MTQRTGLVSSYPTSKQASNYVGNLAAQLVSFFFVLRFHSSSFTMFLLNYLCNNFCWDRVAISPSLPLFLRHFPFILRTIVSFGWELSFANRRYTIIIAAETRVLNGIPTCRGLRNCKSPSVSQAGSLAWQSIQQSVAKFIPMGNIRWRRRR